LSHKIQTLKLTQLFSRKWDKPLDPELLQCKFDKGYGIKSLYFKINNLDLFFFFSNFFFFLLLSFSSCLYCLCGLQQLRWCHTQKMSQPRKEEAKLINNTHLNLLLKHLQPKGHNIFHNSL